MNAVRFDNVSFPMHRHTDWGDADIRDRARAKLAAVGLEEEFDKMPGDLSGGMKKRAGLDQGCMLASGTIGGKHLVCDERNSRVALGSGRVRMFTCVFPRTSARRLFGPGALPHRVK